MKQKYAYLIIIISSLFSIHYTYATTNNYYGTTGDMYGNFWNTVDNTYSSAMDVTGGAILNFNNATTTAIGPSSNITVAGINVNANVTIGTVGAGTITNLSNGAVTITVGTGNTFDASTQTFSGNATVSYTKAGAGVFATNGNSYSGGFTLSAGTIMARGNNTMGNGGPLTINGGTIAATAARDFSGKYTGITIGGDFTLGSTTGLALSSAGLTFNTATSLGTATRTITLGGTGAYTLSGVISETSTAGLTVSSTAAGTLILGGANTYTGVTTVNSGVLLRLTNASALGTIAGNTVVNSGGGLQLNGINYSTAEPLTINGTGISSAGAINNSGSAIATFAGPITLATSSTINGGVYGTDFTGTVSGTGNLTITGSGGGSLQGAVSYTGNLTKANTGTWTLSSTSNSYSGSTTLTAGTLCLGAAGVIPNGSSISFNGGTLCTGATVGYTETVNLLNMTASSTIALGTGSHNLIFADSHAQSWTASTVLTITGWNNTSGGRIYVGSNSSGLTSGQLAMITFSGYAAGAAINAGTGEITPAGGAVAPTLTADNSLNTVDNNIDITFSDSPVWRAAVTAVNIQISNTPTYTTLAAGTDYDLTSGHLLLKPSGGNSYLNSTAAINGLAGGVKPIVIIATGYANSTISQTIDNGVATQLSINAQPAAPASNGAVLATQPVVKTLDQYGNGTPTTADVTATVSAGAWEIGGTLTQTASGRLTTFTDLVAYSDAAVTGATIIFSSTGLTSVTSGTFNIPVPTASPALTAAVGATVDAAFDVTFTDVPAWRSAIRKITVGGTTLAAGAYNATVAGKITFTPSVSTLLQSNGTKSIIIYSTGYSSGTVSQAIGVGAVSASTSTAAIDANLSGGATRTITCTAKDQYNNLVSGYVFKYDATITNSNVTTTESYTIDGVAKTATANDLTLGVTNGAGVKTFTVVMPVTIDSGDGLVIQVQLNNGSTNVGSDFGNVLVAQTITFGALSNKINGDVPFALTATASSGLAVSYSSSDTNVATVSGSTVTIVGVGSTTITASQAGDGSYTAASSVPQGLNITNTPNYTISSNTNISTLITSSTSDIVVASGNTLTIDSNKLIHDLTVESGAKVNFSGAYTLSTVGNVILKADKSTGSFSVNLGSGALGITGTSKFLKTMDDTKWFFMSFPSNIAVNNITFTGGYSYALGTDYFIKYYDGNSRIQNLGASSNWKNVTAGSTLNAGDGYIFGLATGIGGDREMIFPLTNADVQSESARTVNVTAYGEGVTTNTLGNTVGANHKGWNLVGQPYISKLAGTGVGVNYMTLYDGSGYTTYANTDVTTLDPFTSFFVQADAALQSSAVTYSLASRQSLPSSVKNDTIDKVRLYFQTPTGIDNTNLVLGDHQTNDYQIGQDMEKWITRGTDKPQVYTMLNGINYAFNALPVANVQNLPLGVYTNATGNATISTDAQSAPNLTQLLLTDTSNGTTTDLLTSIYSFTVDAGTNNGRFLLSAQRTSTEIPKISMVQAYCSVVSGKLLINKLTSKSKVMVYDAFGSLVASELANSSTIEMALPSKGVYIVQFINASTTICQKVICR